MLLVFIILLMSIAYADLTLFDSSSSTFIDLSERFVSTTQFHQYNSYVNQPYVSNGLIGSRIPNLGFGFTYDQNQNSSSSYLSNGWPLFNKRYSGAFVSGFFNAQKNTTGTNFPSILNNGGYESVISSIPQWTDLNFFIENNGKEFVLNPKNIQTQLTNYTQSLNMSNGIVTTSYLWMNLIEISISVFAHAEIGQLGMMEINLNPMNDKVNITIDQFLTSKSCERCHLNKVGVDGDSIYIDVSPTGVLYKSAVIHSLLKSNDIAYDSQFATKQDKVIQRVQFELTKPTKFIKYSSIVSSDIDDDIEYDELIYELSNKTVYQAYTIGYEKLLQAHLLRWKDNWGDIGIKLPSDRMTQISIEGSIYHLLSNTRPGNAGLKAGLSVSGLSSDSYAGLIFWDMDLWMIPALIPISPNRAISAFKYRSYLHSQARENAQQYGYAGAIFPWTSGGFGNCTGTGPCVDYEYHLNFAITYSIWKLYLSGSIDKGFLKDYGWPILKDSADFFIDYVQWNEEINKYETSNLTDPDEYANFKNNGAYTNVGISQSLKWTILVADILNYDVNEKWVNVMENMKLPVSPNSNITLEYDGMTNDILVKQADVVLISYLDDQDQFLPNLFGYDRQRAINDLVYYAYHQSSQGPALTFPVYGAVAQKLHDVGCGFMTYLKKSYEPFIRFPFIQMSEQNNDNYDINGGTHPAFPFNTGHAGVIQGFYYGLLGIRYSYFIKDEFKRVLHIDPVKLPLFNGDFKMNGFKYMNESIDITVNETYVNLKKLTNIPIGIYVDHRNKMGGYHELVYELDIPLFETRQNFQGSITECSSNVISKSKGMDGDIPQSIVDGDNSTTWQSYSKKEKSTLLIDLKSELSFSNGVLIWGSRPPLKFSISKVDSIDSNETILILGETEVEISNPYLINSPVELNDRNYTMLDFKEDITGKYIILSIEGVIDDDDNDHGGEIAEFILY